MADRDQRLGAHAEAELRQLAYRDHLTGLPNRIAMADRIEVALARSSKEGRSSALLFIDVDGFKRVNDTLGHLAGDDLLRLIGQRLAELCAAHVSVGRHSGDEFLVLIDDLPHDRAAAMTTVAEVGERVVSAMRQPFTVARSTFELGASVGTSLFPADAHSHHELVERADQAMFAAKRRGGGQLAVFDVPETHSLLALEATLRMRRALEHGEFEVFYQPIVEIADGGGLGGLEALLRWRDPDGGLLSPETFLPHVEDSPLVEEIGEWVFTEICRQLADWRARGFSPHVSFNVPARQLRRLGFAEFVITTAGRYGADLSRLAAEITETSPVALEEVLPTLGRLRDAGFVLSLDDFGTGYSSLGRLRSMPFTLLKTDRSFMGGIPGDPVAEELLHGIIALGKTLGLRVIVEGVESAEQEHELLRLGARLAQGYHLGPPVPPAQIEARWAQSAERV